MTDLKHLEIAENVRVKSLEQFRNLVLVVVSVDLHIPVPVFVLYHVHTYCEVETAVVHLCDVSVTGTETCRIRIRYGHQHVRCNLIVILQEVYAVEQTAGQSDVECLDLLPCEIGVGSIGYDCS